MKPWERYGTTETAKPWERFAAKGTTPPPGYGGADVDRSDPNPLWDIPGDVSKAYQGGVEALKSDVARAFPGPPAPTGQGVMGAIKRIPDEAMASVGRMGSALKIPFDALSVAMSPVTGAARATIGSALSYAPGGSKEKADETVDKMMMALPARATVAAKKPMAPSVAELKQAGDAGYTAARNMGAEIDPKATSRLADDVTNALNQAGFRDYLSPKTFRVIEELKNPPGPTVTISDVEGVRRVLSEAGLDKAERGAARLVRDRLDQYMANIPQADVVAGDPAMAAAKIREARANIAASKRAERVDKAVTDADLNTASANSGANADNALRQQIKVILKNPKQRAGFSPDEIEQMERVVKGTATGNTLRFVGNLLGGGGGLGSVISSAAGYGLAGPAGIGAPLVGMGAKAAGGASTARQARLLDEMVRARSPLGQSRAQGGLMSVPAPVSAGGLGLMGMSDQVSRSPRMQTFLDWLARQEASAQ